MSPEAKLLKFQPIRNESAGIKHFKVGDEDLSGPDPRDFPLASQTPSLPTTIPDEVLDLYAFLFRQRGFRSLGITFEQFLIVIATVAPDELSAQ
jgi:hypothetical protein